MMIGMACATYLALTGRRWVRAGGAGLFVILAAGLLVTMTRSAALGFIAFGGVLFLLPGVLPRRFKLLLVALAIVAAVAAPASVKTRFGSLRFLASERSIHNRPFMLMAGLRMARDNPLGVGLQNFELHYNEYKLTTDMEVSRAAHNMYVELGATAGLPALACFLGWIWVTGAGLVSTWRRARLTRQPETATLSAFLLAIICGLLVQGLFHTNPFHDKFFWLFMGLAQVGMRWAPPEPSAPINPPDGGSV